MNRHLKSLVAFLGAIALGTGLAVAVGVYVGGGDKGIEQECRNLAWKVANRNHSILDSAAFRATESQAYRTCISDPESFGRLVRRGR